MSLNNKSPAHHVALGAATEGLTAASSSLAVVARYWWNLQMQLLVATGAMRFFKAFWWLFLIVGFLLLAFVLPLGVAYVVSAFCAMEMNPNAEDNFIVALKHEVAVMSGHPKDLQQEDVSERTKPYVWDDLRIAAGLHHAGYLLAIEREVDDIEFAAAALGAFDGTVQARDLKLSDLDMYTMGAALILGQLKDLGRMQEASPDWIAEVTTAAMSSNALEVIRAEAGRFAYEMEGAMQHGPAPLPA